MPEEVVVVHVDTPGDFYVQRKTAQIDLKKIDCFIDPFHVEKQRPVSRVNLDDIYLAKFAADGKWYRVRVTQIPPPGSPPDAPLTLLYIDWGNGDQQPLCRPRPCPGRIKSIPALANHRAMYDLVFPVHSRAWEDDESSVSMQVYTILPNNNQYCVDLHVLGEYGTVSVRSTLLALNYARQYKSGSSSVSSVDSRHDPVPLTKTNSVYTVDSGSSSKSAVKPNMEAVKKNPPSWPDNIASVLNNLLGVSETEQPPFSLCVSNQDNPSSGVQKVILYKREGGKEECMNKKLVDMKLAKAVYFIDIGNEELVPLPNLKPIEPEFTQEMDGVIACRLSGIVCADSEDAQVWPDYVVDRLREFVENNRGCLYIYKSGPLKDHVLPIHLWIKKLKVAGPFSPSVTTWICVNRLLISEACAHPTEQEEFTGKHFESPFTSDTLGNTDAAQLISSKLNTRKTKTLPSCGVGSGVRPELAYPVAIHS
ncbi:uncharacterized protein LOC113472228 [Diaphorina citri]|uniref:Uncharacterized protein LOC113472228 n=1 Tax=Diaphorina citri TaxID=121845 RepID=A0A3Q0JLF9_DIACI|nr:uncharacterized protein LOC113472228 [Diaphorina citri]